MTGEILYRMYRKFHADQGVEIDEWQDIEPTDRAAWDALALWIADTE